MSMPCSEHSTQLETIFLSEAFLVVLIHQYFLSIYMQIKYCIAFTCVNPLLFLLPFTIFIVLILFSMNFKSNFSLILKPSVFFIWFPFYQKKSLDPFELACKM